jgi:CHAD domain-containing protein
MPINSERCQFVFQKTERDLLKLSSGQQAEQVHSFRTSSRRLQTLLEDLVPQRSRNEKKLLKLVSQIRKRAGKVRDLDVQLAALRALKIPQEPRRKTQLMHALIELRAKHENKLRKLLTKDAIRETRKRLKRASKEMKLETGSDPLAVARQMLAQVRAPEARAPEARLTEPVLHRYRVVVKRARYAAEFAPKSAGASQFLEQLQRLQDAIGDWHDWLTLTHTATARLGDVSQSPLVAALHNLTGSKFRRAVAALSDSPTVQPAPTVQGKAAGLRKLGTTTPTLVERASPAA